MSCFSNGKSQQICKIAYLDGGYRGYERVVARWYKPIGAVTVGCGVPEGETMSSCPPEIGGQGGDRSATKKQRVRRASRQCSGGVLISGLMPHQPSNFSHGRATSMTRRAAVAAPRGFWLG